MSAEDIIARQACDEAYRWGDRLHGWDDSGADVRETFREGARRVLAALGAEGFMVARMTQLPLEARSVAADGENIACWGPTLVQVQQAKTELATEKNDGD